MILTTEPRLQIRTPGVRVVPLRGGKWRVTSRDGALLGFFEATGNGEFRATRYSVRERRFRVLGEFRNATSATDALRYP